MARSSALIWPPIGRPSGRPPIQERFTVPFVADEPGGPAGFSGRQPVRNGAGAGTEAGLRAHRRGVAGGGSLTGSGQAGKGPSGPLPYAISGIGCCATGASFSATPSSSTTSPQPTWRATAVRWPPSDTAGTASMAGAGSCAACCARAWASLIHLEIDSSATAVAPQSAQPAQAGDLRHAAIAGPCGTSSDSATAPATEQCGTTNRSQTGI